MRCLVSFLDAGRTRAVPGSETRDLVTLCGSLGPKSHRRCDRPRRVAAHVPERDRTWGIYLV